jgi:integrase/recombinase XerD
MNSEGAQLPTQIRPGSRLLTAAEFHRLADAARDRLVGEHNQPHTRRAYEKAVRDFKGFAGIRRPEEFRVVTRAHIIAWRDELVSRGLGGGTGSPRCSNISASGMP